MSAPSWRAASTGTGLTMPPSTKWYFADGDGLEHAGHAARCAHGLACVAACKHGALAVFQPRGHDHKRLGHLLQRLAAHLLVHIVFELLAQQFRPPDESCRSRILASSSATAFPAFQRRSFHWRRARPPRCLLVPDTTAGAKAVGLQHLDDANARNLGCATAQGDADADRGRRKEQAASPRRAGRGGAATSSQGQGCQHGYAGKGGQRWKKAVKRMPGGPPEQRGAKYRAALPHTRVAVLLLKM